MGVSNLIDLEIERIDRSAADCGDVTPEQILRIALRDTQEGDVRACYVTLINESGEAESSTHYRSNLTRSEEAGYRQLGVQQILDDWRGNL